ncbi:retinol dehydrogenase 12-like isoform 2-T2 [Pholidichthys leucotaenia]
MAGIRKLCHHAWSSTERLDGKTILITGANTGIGKETAIDLAKRGAAKVIIACRDMEKGQAAVTDIIERSSNQNVVCMKLDLADSKSIREFAEAINRDEPKLHILINNAGVMLCPYGKTADGFEMQMGVNHMGTGVTTYSLHPGVVQTDLWRHLSGPEQFVYKMTKPFTKNSTQGAQTSIYCAVEPSLEKESGGYYSDCAPAKPSSAGRNDELAEKLWKLSCCMLSITWE